MDRNGRMFTSSQAKRIIARMKSSVFGIPLKHRGGTFNNCFVGFEGVDWMVKDAALSRTEATTFLQSLLDQSIITCIWPDAGKVYLDEDEAYYIMNTTARGQNLVENSDASTGSISESKANEPRKMRTLVAQLEDLSLADIKTQVQRQLFGSDEEVQLCIRVVLSKGPRGAMAMAAARGATTEAPPPAATNTSTSKSSKNGTSPSTLSSRDNAPSPAATKGQSKELLCVTLKASSQRLHLHRIQYTSGTYSIVDAWSLEDLKSLNFVENSDTGFVMGLEATYKFTAEVSTERNEFLWGIFQMYQQYLNRIPQTSIELLELRLLLEGDGVKGLVSSDENRFITDEEEQQIEEFLKSRSVQDLDILADELSRDLLKLESRNINDLIQEHFAIKEIWEGLKGAADRVQDLGDFNRQYMEKLDAISTYFEQIEQKNNRMAVITRNQQKLLDELQKLLDTISLGGKATRCLERGTFEKGEALDSSISAATELRNLLHHNLPPGLVDMKAVHQQMEIYLKLRGQFAKRMRGFLDSTFKNASETGLASKARGLQFMEHSKLIYQQLQPFQPLVAWLREMELDLRNPSQYKAYKIEPDELAGRIPGDTPNAANDYLIHLSQVWRKELVGFYHYVRKLVIRENVPKLSFKMNWDLVDQVTLGMIKKPKKSKSGATATERTDLVTASTWDDDDDDDLASEMEDLEDDTAHEPNAKGKQKSSSSGGTAMAGGKVKKEDQMPVVRACVFGLKSLLPLVLAEQSFLKQFFQFSDAPGSASGSIVSQMVSTSSTAPTAAGGVANAIGGGTSSAAGGGAMLGTMSLFAATSVNSSIVQTSDLLAVLSNQSELDLFLERLIDTWPQHINVMIDRAFKIDRFNCISLWVQTHLIEAEYKSNSSYILSVCTQIKSTVKTLFDRYITEQVGFINETKYASVKAVGILPHAMTFIQFVDRVEANGGPQGSAFVEPAYAKLTSALFQWLNQLGEDEETRLAVRYENFQYLNKQIMVRKVANLNLWCDKAKAISDESLVKYVQLLISKRFNSVMDFFDGVDKLYKTVPAENIQFQHTHSNQVIGKLLQKFKLDMVEEGLWKEFRRIKRDITADSSYTDEVWRTLKSFFLSKCKHFQSIVVECYRQQKFPFNPSDIESKYKAIEDRWEAKLRKKSGIKEPKSSETSSTVSSRDPHPSSASKHASIPAATKTNNDETDDAITEFDDVSELDTSD